MLIEREPNAASGGELPRISQEVTERFYNLSPVAHSVRCPSWVDTVEKGILRGSLSNIDSRRASNEQHRFKDPFARIRLFQILIPQLHFGDFFNSIDPNRQSDHLPCGQERIQAGHAQSLASFGG